MFFDTFELRRHFKTDFDRIVEATKSKDIAEFNPDCPSEA